MRIIALLLLSSLAGNLLAQASYFATRQSAFQNYTFYDWEGTPSFQLTYGERPIITDEYGTVNHSPLPPLTWIPSTITDTLIIRHHSGWQIRNSQGNLLHELPGEYQAVGPAGEGLLLAWQPDSTRRNWKWGHYLHPNGRAALPDQRFWQATAFAEGMALVQETRNGPWQIINRQGQVLANLPHEMSPHIQKVHPFQDGLAFVQAYMPVGYDRRQKKLRYFWVNHQGEVVLDPSEIVPAIGSVDFWIEPFQDGVASVRYRCGKYHCLAYFNKEGRILQSFAEAEAFSDWRQGQLYVRYREGEEIISQFFNTAGEAMPWPSALQADWEYVKTAGDHFVFRQASRAEQPATFAVYDPASEELVLDNLHTQPFYAQEGRFFFGAYRDQRLDSVLNSRGQIIFQPGPDIRVFESLADALPYADQVQYLDLAEYKEPQLDQLGQFKQLKYLRLYEYPFTKLPAAVLANESLEMLSLSGCRQLQRLPPALAQLEQLRELQLSNCLSLTGLETIIEQHGRLRRVFTENYDYAADFEARMKDEQPQLRIDSWHSLGDFDDVIEEEPPAPVTTPAPPARHKND